MYFCLKYRVGELLPCRITRMSPMRNVYYKYNEKTKMYDRVFPSRRERLLTTLRSMLFCLLLGVAGYGIMLLVLGTPENVEELREENVRLRGQYMLLSQRVDEAMEVMDDICQRDDNLYRVLMNAEPVSETARTSGYGGTSRYDELMNMDNAALVVETTQKADMLAKQIYLQIKSFDEIVELSKEQEDYLKHLPAIQPISNRDLKRTASGYGYRIDPIYKTQKFHSGMDFSCDVRTPVYATGDAVVVSSKWETGYGMTVELDHGYGYRTRYAHLQSSKVKVGQKVVRGEQIADSGNTGKSSGPHLHYEVVYKGRKVNPVNYYFMDLDADGYDEMLRMVENHGKVYD